MALLLQNLTFRSLYRANVSFSALRLKHLFFRRFAIYKGDLSFLSVVPWGSIVLRVTP